MDRFVFKITPSQFGEQQRRWNEELKESREEEAAKKAAIEALKLEKKRESTKARVQRHRERKKANKVSDGSLSGRIVSLIPESTECKLRVWTWI